MAGLAWTDLTPAHLETLGATPDPAQKIQLLCEAVAVKHYADNTWSGILVDFLYYSLLFCEERGMAPEKTSAFFSIMKRVFEYTFRPDLEPGNVHPAEPRIAMEDSFAFFKDQMLAHSVEDVETAAVGLFSVQDVECVAEFISTTFYRHFKAYAYCFYHKQPDECVERALVVETPLPPPPLAEAEFGEGGFGVPGPAPAPAPAPYDLPGETPAE